MVISVFKTKEVNLKKAYLSSRARELYLAASGSCFRGGRRLALKTGRHRRRETGEKRVSTDALGSLLSRRRRRATDELVTLYACK